MRFPPFRLLLRNGETVVLREACPEDAAQLIVCKREVILHSRFMPFAEGEYCPDLLQEQQLITSFAGDNCLLLVAVHDGRIIGNLDLKAGGKQYTRHTAGLAIGILQQWQGAGLGKAMMAAALSWAGKSSGLELIWLEVFETNAVALQLYLKTGFAVTGRKERFIRRDDGHYVNLITMCLDLSGRS